VAITFDDGPSPDSTPAVLDRLGELGVKATFFCLGQAVRRDPELVARMLAEGHEVALHGERHVHHLMRSARFIDKDLTAGLDSLRAAGARPRFYRPAYGQVSGGTVVAAWRHGLETVLWSAWGREWKDRDPASVAARIGRRLGPGAIVLLHDTDHKSPSGSWRVALDALTIVAGECEQRGLATVTLSALVDAGLAAAPAASIGDAEPSEPSPVR
jgi:peptidoglycan/xylan/chitin deacetylase (PgdA/CDA1 family)